MMKILMPDTSIEQFNHSLIEKHESISIVDYFLRLHSCFFSAVDISSMKYFLELSDSKKIDNFCIHEKDLRKYNIVHSSMKIKDIIHKYHLLKDRDWTCRIEKRDPKKDKHLFLGITFFTHHHEPEKTFLFTPRAFKKMILLSAHPLHVEYYLLVENVFRYYHDYQMELLKKINEEHVKKTEKLTKEICTLKQEVKKILPIVEILDECSSDLKSSFHTCNTIIEKFKKISLK